MAARHLIDSSEGFLTPTPWGTTLLHFLVYLICKIFTVLIVHPVSEPSAFFEISSLGCQSPPPGFPQLALKLWPYFGFLA